MTLTKEPIITNVEKKTKPYTIKGFYFDKNRRTIEDTHYDHIGCNSMIDHQRTWYREAQKLDYDRGEIDEAAIINANYTEPITEEEMIAITNDGILMDTPFNDLFPKELTLYLTKLRAYEE